MRLPGWRWVASVTATVVILPVIGQFFIELADDLGAYTNSLERVQWALTAVTSNSAFPWICGILIGFSTGTWVDIIARRAKTPEEPTALALIDFDSTNPEGRYWSTATWTHFEAKITGTEYRVAITNLTRQSLREVTLKVEILIDGHWRPGTGEFLGSGTARTDIHPLACEYAKILLHTSPALGDGEVLVTVSGATLPPVSQRYSVKQGRVPLIEAM